MNWMPFKGNVFLRRLRWLGFVRRLLRTQCQSCPAYKDWADYFERAPRATEDFVATVAEGRRDLLRLEERVQFD